MDRQPETGSAIGLELKAGVSRADITNYDAGPANDTLYVKALVIRTADESVVLLTVDAVALEEIGPVPGDFLPNVRSRLHRELGVEEAHVFAFASHCHGSVVGDLESRTVQAVREAWEQAVPVTVGAGTGRESRIMENRRLKLRSGAVADVRHAYSLPPDDEVESVGPIDPEIGILKLDREDGSPLAVVYNLACHPIQGVPAGANTADLVGLASEVIEANLSGNATALFLQGCAGDVNPVSYKAVDYPRDAGPLGTYLGLSVLAGVRGIVCGQTDQFRVFNERLSLPRADLTGRIAALEQEQDRLLNALRGTTLNLKNFLLLTIKHGLAPDFPSADSHRYLHQKMTGKHDLQTLDASNRQHVQAYRDNILTMEQLTRVRENLRLLKMHHQQNLAAGSDTLEVEVAGMRLGNFVLVAFPGELSVEIGLRIKARSPHLHTFVAGCANGYIYYTPTAEQLRNPGSAQEDCDCLVAPEWQRLFEDKVQNILSEL